MSTMTKVFVVLTCVLAIVLSSMTIATAARWSNLRENLESYQQLYQAEFVKRMNAEAVMATALAMKDDELQKRERIVSRKEDELRAMADQLVTLRNDLARRTNEAIAADAGRKKLEEILEVQTAELTSLQKHNQALLAQTIDLQTRNQRLASRNLEITGQLTIQIDENRNLQERLYAQEQLNKQLQEALASGRRALPAAEPPAGVLPVLPPVAGPITGEVTQVDGSYVSINVGESSGVVPGMDFMVYRGQTYVGDLKVQNVRPKEAGGKLTLVKPGDEVRPGDRVVYGLDGG
mgnify:CR=1 FL=1